MLLLKYLNDFWKNLEMPLINCVLNLILTWSVNSVISGAAATAFAITDIIEVQKPYLDYLIDSNF